MKTYILFFSYLLLCCSTLITVNAQNASIIPNNNVQHNHCLLPATDAQDIASKITDRMVIQYQLDVKQAQAIFEVHYYATLQLITASQDTTSETSKDPDFLKNLELGIAKKTRLILSPEQWQQYQYYEQDMEGLPKNPWNPSVKL